jgi:hypothetical protein
MDGLEPWEASKGIEVRNRELTGAEAGRGADMWRKDCSTGLVPWEEEVPVPARI